MKIMIPLTLFTSQRILILVGTYTGQSFPCSLLDILNVQQQQQQQQVYLVPFYRRVRSLLYVTAAVTMVRDCRIGYKTTICI